MVDAILPLTLLRSVRNHDTPEELLPEENLGAAFPTRLGLSGVVEEQIRFFERLARRNRRISREQVVALLKLIARRPDAETIFEEAGRELASLRFQGVRGRARRLTRRLPKGFRRRATARGLRAAHGATLIASELEVHATPLALRARDSLTASLGDDQRACRLYGSLLESLAKLNGSPAGKASHSKCQVRGDEECLWELDS